MADDPSFTPAEANFMEAAKSTRIGDLPLDPAERAAKYADLARVTGTSMKDATSALKKSGDGLTGVWPTKPN